MKRMILAGGGTGGHLFPAVALAEEFVRQEKGEVLFVGTERGIEATVLPKLSLPLATVDISGYAGRGLFAKIGVLLKLLKSIGQGMRIIDHFKPDLVVGVGGYASAPLVMAAKIKRLPIVLHEQNAEPGMTNRLLGRWVDKVCVSFEQTVARFDNAILTGNPLRQGLEECSEADPTHPLLLVFGGSRGARAINETLCQALPYLSGWQEKLTILHQTGEADVESVRAAYAAAGWKRVEVTPFIDDMAAAYSRAHLVLCRAGATTVAELTACGRPALLVPYPHAAGDHQRINAEALAKKGAALLLPQHEIDSRQLAAIISGLLEKPEELKSMARVARSLGRHGVAAEIIDICRKVTDDRKAA